MHNCAVLPNDDLLIADSWNHCVRRVSAQSQLISTIAGTGKRGFSGDGGPATQATLDFVMCITLNPAATVLHIADLNNRRIRGAGFRDGSCAQRWRATAARGLRRTAAAVDAPLVDPRAAAEDSAGRLYVLERGGISLRWCCLTVQLARLRVPDGRVSLMAVLQRLSLAPNICAWVLAT
ncbi:MAG UNVERIFIED_CONTAM: hypothetical protein LVR18_42460 [Planctomycetaceae bacterium]|jgi:hypothetical protein